MHLALNFQRVDPSRGGAETYVADLCRALAQGGHRVDLYAESWADDCLPREVNVIPVAGTGRNKLERIWNFADHSEQAMRYGRHECSVGFINTWAHDVIIPQGGVQEGSLRANAGRFSTAVHGQAYRLVKAANPEVLGPSRHRAPAIRPGAYGALRGRQPDGPPASGGVSPRRPAADSRRAQRDRRPPPGSRAARRVALRIPQPPGSGAARPGRPIRRPQLRAQGPAPADHGPGRAPSPQPVGPGDPPAGLRRRRYRSVRPHGEPTGDSRPGPLPRLLPRYPRYVLVERLLRPADVSTIPARSSSSKPWRAACP